MPDTRNATNRLSLVDPATAEGRAGELLAAVKSKMGMVPNMTRAMANAPAALDAYLQVSGAVGNTLTPALREKIALFTAQENSCDYCLAAHTAIGGMVGLDSDSIRAARSGNTADAKEAAALSFAKDFLDHKGAVSNATLESTRAAGWDDAGIAEIAANVVVNIYTNYFNRLADTDIDFPAID